MRKGMLWWGLGLVAMGLGTAATVHAQSLRQTAKVRTASPAAPDERWRDALEAFAAADRLQTPRRGGVLFVGSSSIRLWEGLEQAFASTPVLRRGFGGASMVDCARHVDLLVLPHAPRLVVVYAGDNDLAEGRTPQEILQSFTEFVERVQQALPDTRIAYLSIKPSPSRVALMEQARVANALVAAYAATQPQLDFIDVFGPMLDAGGRPRAELFLPDALHLNADGYALWQSVISAHLGPRQPSARAAVMTTVAAPAAAQAGRP